MSEYSSRPLSILFVEDEPDIRTIVEIALGLDPTVTMKAFGSAEEALQALEHDTPPFDVALLNIKLPIMSGFQLMARLHAHPAYLTLPVVFITSSIRPEELGTYVEAGARGTIGKPFDPLMLINELRALLA